MEIDANKRISEGNGSSIDEVEMTQCLGSYGGDVGGGGVRGAGCIGLGGRNC